VQRLADVASCSLFQQVGGASRIGFNLSYMIQTPTSCGRIEVQYFGFGKLNGFELQLRMNCSLVLHDRE